MSNNIENLINEGISKMLSLDDVRKALSYRVSIFTYEELGDMKSIDQLFAEHPNVVLLYQTTDENTGHWVSLINFKDYIEYFDSYGNPMDYYLDERYNPLDNPPYLTKLIADSGKTLVESNFRLQKMELDYNTCGRWTIVRALMLNYKLEDFIDLFKKLKNSKDFIITALTFFIGE